MDFLELYIIIHVIIITFVIMSNVQVNIYNLKFLLNFKLIICFYILLEFFENKHVIIICTTLEQLVEQTKCKHFQIDISFKRVASNINKFEINYYNTEHNLS